MTEIQEVRTEAITRVQIARYAGAVGDFNPMHVDEEFAKAAGMDSVIAHGPLTIALAIDAVVAQVGGDRMRAFDARLRAPVGPGDQLTITSTEAGIDVSTASGSVATAAVQFGEAQ
jgi:acyl dehydratase